MTNSGLVTPHSRPTTPNTANSAAGQTTTGPTTTSTTTPKTSIPSYEKPIYEELNQTYKKLLELKNNRNKYINSKQIYTIYDNFLNILNDLKLTRKDEELKGITLNLPNTNDLLTDDIFQLLSLCFVTCGLTKFAPATYSSLSTVMKLLNHLKEGKVYTMEDLNPIGTRLEEIRGIVISTTNYDDDDDEETPEEKKASSLHNKNQQIEETLLRNKLIRCETLYQELENNFKTIPKDLEPTYHKLIELRQNIISTIIGNKEDKGQSRNLIKHEKLIIKINQFKTELKKIEQLRDETDNKFHSSDGSDLDEKKSESLQAIMNGLIDECHNLLQDLLLQDENEELSHSLSSLNLSDENKSLKKSYDALYRQLQDLKLTLENLLVTRRWTLRETDLYTYQKQLKTFDEQRLDLLKQDVDKAFKKSQLLVLFLLRRCYALVYKLLESSEPVSESLTPIHNQLQTVKRCLLELKRVDGLNNLRELFPFQFKLGSLDNLRHDGKFIVDGSIPEGQGTLNALLAECFDIVQEMKIELEEKEYENEEDEDVTPGANGGSFTNSRGVDNESFDSTDDDVEIKRNRFHNFNEADYDLESESAYDDDDDDDLSLSESEPEGNDYY
ncbi:CUB1 Cu(2+) suppressing and bleomycin sensitive protein 1 [Candida maltosa Xu316]|uniref:Uncharacterized protein n=1 Tax=Candida maltosa (strain Xu316) TaxID=1245528 RepID=M3HQ92_CANMX|nr:hypothetical protein G210_5564 [Candida maltosa Xu316]